MAIRAKLDEKGKRLLIEIDLESPPVRSASGKSFVVATTRGNQKTDLVVDGKPVTIGLNAYVKA